MKTRIIIIVAGSLMFSAQLLSPSIAAAQTESEKDRQWRSQQPAVPADSGTSDDAEAAEKLRASAPPSSSVGPVAAAPGEVDSNQVPTFSSPEDVLAWIEAGAPIDGSVPGQPRIPRVLVCPTGPPPGEGGIAGGGMTGGGWDGSIGQNSASLTFNVENITGDIPAWRQRAAFLAALQAWSSVVQISFVELPIANMNGQVDWSFQTGNHCAAEAAECGDPDCPFAGAGGVLAHAAFPPGVNSQCGGAIGEHYAGNVHFDEAETWEQNNEGATGDFSLTLIAVHELGHALGLIHSNDPNDVMRPTFSDTDTWNGLAQGDIDNIRSGYATGSGTVTTLEQTGVWVNLNAAGSQFQYGTSALPFSTVPQGVGGVPPGNSGVTLHIQAGTYLQTVFADKPMTMRAENGVVRIGGN